MKNDNRFALFLAALDLSLTETREFVRDLKSCDEELIMRLVRRLRSAARSVRSDEEGKPEEHRTLVSARSRIYALLIDDAKLSPTQAARMLRQELLKFGDYDIPDISKEGFERWLLRVQRSVPRSALLHVATRLRNQLAHSETSSAWPIERSNGV